MRTWGVTVLLSAGAAALAACGGGSGPTGPAGPASIVSVNGATAPAGPLGSTVLIEGSNFGSSQGAGMVLFSDGAGGTVSAAIASAGDWSDQFIITTVPSGAATGNLVVETSKGTSNALVFTVTASQAFSPSTISWTSTTALPAGRRGLALTQVVLPGVNLVYALGGEDNTGAPTTTVYTAAVGATGSLGAWSTSAALPKATAFLGAVAATPANSRVTARGYIYLIGGDTAAGGVPTAAVYRGALAADGSVGSWSSVATLPQPLHSAAVTLFDGDLYVYGGSGAGQTPVAAAYRSRIDGLGNLGAWQSLAPLPFKRSYFGSGQFGGVLYAFGGDSGTVTPDSAIATPTTTDDVVYAKINLRTGNLTSAGWTENPAKLKKVTSKHTAVVAAGSVLITGGIYNGASTGSTEESYAQFNADGTTGSFNGATGSNTIRTLGGGSPFNHTALGYVDGNGAFHVLVAGGDDVAAPGTAHTGVYFY
jgi:hypothetical protein